MKDLIKLRRDLDLWIILKVFWVFFFWGRLKIWSKVVVKMIKRLVNFILMIVF